MWRPAFTIKKGRIPKSLTSRSNFKILITMGDKYPKNKPGKIIIDDEKKVKDLEKGIRAEINDPEIDQKNKPIADQDELQSK
ncbi:MAG TPA: hypothetical protein GXX67_02345 [Petrimonas sp.]|jgi:hypothetical protein|nr:hypothetical protein [Petrimonas sp.]